MADAVNNLRPFRTIRTIRTKGFTLTELMVVVGLIVLVTTISLPTISAIINSGADLQAYNVFSAQITSARALAVSNGTQALLHCQMGMEQRYIGSGDYEWIQTDRCWSAVMSKNLSAGTFSLASRYDPYEIPGNFAFGELNSSYVDTSVGSTAGDYIGTALDSTGELDSFTTFSIVFDGVGSVTVQVGGTDPSIATGEALFANLGGTDSRNTKALWDSTFAGVGEPGATAVTMFHYPTAKAIIDSGNDLQSYLNQHGQIIAVNVHTGMLFPRE